MNSLFFSVPLAISNQPDYIYALPHKNINCISATKFPKVFSFSHCPFNDLFNFINYPTSFNVRYFIYFLSFFCWRSDKLNFWLPDVNNLFGFRVFIFPWWSHIQFYVLTKGVKSGRMLKINFKYSSERKFILKDCCLNLMLQNISPRKINYLKICHPSGHCLMFFYIN